MTAKVKTPVSGAAKRILYIENHEDSRAMLTILLGKAGFEVATATNVANGLSLARLERFDLYILDSIFSDGTGLDLCRQIRALDPLTPIIFYSSAAYESDIKAGMAAGAQGYLIKPTGIEIIEQTVIGLLAGTTAARAYAQ